MLPRVKGMTIQPTEKRIVSDFVVFDRSLTVRMSVGTAAVQVAHHERRSGTSIRSKEQLIGDVRDACLVGASRYNAADLHGARFVKRTDHRGFRNIAEHDAHTDIPRFALRV
jgi:hypothetical protein